VSKHTFWLLVNAFGAGMNAGAFALRVYLGLWDAFNVAALIGGLGWFAGVLWQVAHQSRPAV
jgi:hypothetical protein